MGLLSSFSTDVLAQVITGGSGSAPASEQIAPYRTGREIEKFFAQFRIPYHQSGSESRVRPVEHILVQLCAAPENADVLVKIVECATDFRRFEQYPHLLPLSVVSLNAQFQPDGWTLNEVNGRYRMVSFVGTAENRQRGVDGTPKNIIFASNGPKPEIVLVDAINNVIRIVENADFCLVYDRPILSSGLMWSDLVSWWAQFKGLDPSLASTKKSLRARLDSSLVTSRSEPEKLLFGTYCRAFKTADSRMPALVPQVYLHYDPRTLRELGGKKRLPRQRMDFLMLFSDACRVVIEVDGEQHYSRNKVASPLLYAEMVAADRELRLSGYEVYRFGGDELYGESGAKLVVKFFRDLFKLHGVQVPA